MNHSDHEPSPGWPLSMKISCIVILGIAAFFLIGQHWVHLAGILPFLFYSVMSVDAFVYAWVPRRTQ